ncbi:MAG: dihydrodipicolinate synthase family protein [Bacteroidota bacterium]|nr:dihydrodipicolinate synthase family protein [Bacteroidota bacterium]
MILTKTVGLIAAPYTPYSNDGSVNLDVIDEYAAKLKNNGLRGAFICGSTGESASLSVEERILIAGKWLQHQSSEFRIYVHIGTNSIKDACVLAKHAEENGAFAIAATGPSYFKPGTVMVLVRFMKEIAAAASQTPFYYYHIPGMNQNNLSATEFLHIAMNEIPTLSGLKYTHEDEMEFQLCRQLGDGKLDVLYGRDETLICGLALGARGGVGSTYNFMPGLYTAIIKNFNKGLLDEANELQLISMKVIQLYVKYGGVPAGKVIMKRLGLDLGSPRLPFLGLSKQQEKLLLTELDDLYFFSYALK